MRRFSLPAVLISLVLAANASATARTWTGVTNGNWSVGTNWSPPGMPVTGDALTFPSGPSQVVMNNDLPPGTAFALVQFQAAYTLNGNTLTLAGDLTPNSLLCNANVQFVADARIFGNQSAIFNGTVDINGFRVHIDQGTRFNGGFSGTGIIDESGIFNFLGLEVYGGGPYSGTINGKLILHNGAGLPNATVHGDVIGDGTVGDAFVEGSSHPSAGFLKPGNGNDGFGVLHTKNLNTVNAAAFDVDLDQSGGADQVQVTGTVTLGGSFHATLAGPPPAAGQTFILIANDGNDPIAGTFNSLPEGSTVTVGTSTLTVSYVGGDGNDFTLTNGVVTKIWTGATNGNWSVGSNWTPAGAPAANQPMVFPTSAGTMVMNNDLPPGTILGPIELDAAYTINGNALNLGGDFLGGGDNGSCICNTAVKFFGPVQSNPGQSSSFNGPIDINGQHVWFTGFSNSTYNGPINGTGIIEVYSFLIANGLDIYGGGNFSGTIYGRVVLHNGTSIPNATIVGELRGNGTVGNTTILARANSLLVAFLLPGGESDGYGVLHTKNLATSGNGSYYVDLNAIGPSDSIQVTGSVTLGNDVRITTINSTPAIGQTFVIIDNDGTDPVNGTFTGYPEGAVFPAGDYMFRLTYAGNDGNDVVLTRVVLTSVSLGQSAAETKFGQAFNLIATVNGPSTGTVNFYDGGVLIGSSSMVGGVATLPISTLSLGTHGNLTASFIGSPGYVESSSTPLAHTVKAVATIEARSLRSPSPAGDDVLLRVSVNTTAPIAGTVTVSEEGTTVAQQAVSSTTSIIAVHQLASGLHTLTVTFTDPNFETAGDTVTQLVSGAALSLAGTAVAEGNSGTKVVTLSVHLSAPSLEPVTVAFATDDGTAKAGEDYLAANGTLTFAPGETVKPVNVTIIGDTTLESDEQFLMVLSSPVGALLDGGPATVTLLNDDASFHASAFEYANPGGTSLMLDVYTPITGNGPFPVVLWIPGTVAYTPSGDSPALRQTMRGYVVIVASYRAAGAAVFPAQLDDLKAAVRWIRANAVRLNIDPQHLGVWGSGAGGHLAALLGTTGDAASAGSLAEGNPAFSNRVQAVIAWGGAADLLHLQADAPASCSASFDAATSPQSLLLGCPLQACSAAALAASPQSYVSSDDAPTLLMHGAADCVVPPEQSRRFYTALRTAGVEATLNVIDGVGPFDTYWLSAVANAAVDGFLDAHLKTTTTRRRGAAH